MPTSTSSLTTARSSPLRDLDHAVPPLLRPLVRAYLLGYASVVAPRLFTLLVQHFTRKSYKGDAARQKVQPSFRESLQHILRSGLEWQRFPTFCAALIGGSTLLEVCPHFQSRFTSHPQVPPSTDTSTLIGSPEQGIPGLAQKPLCDDSKKVCT